MKNRNCCYINLHGACRYSKLSSPLSLLFLLFSFPPPSSAPFLFMPNTESRKRESSASAQSSRPCYLPRRGIQPGQKCVLLARVWVSSCTYADFIKVQLEHGVYTGKKGNGSGLGTCNFDKATCMSNWPRFIKLSLLSLSLSPLLPEFRLTFSTFPLLFLPPRGKKIRLTFIAVR